MTCLDGLGSGFSVHVVVALVRWFDEDLKDVTTQDVVNWIDMVLVAFGVESSRDAGFGNGRDDDGGGSRMLNNEIRVILHLERVFATDSLPWWHER